MIRAPENVNWIVDPGMFHRYDENRIYDFISWIEKWEEPVLVNSRFWMLKKQIHFWGANNTFRFGLETEHAAKIFHEKWGGIMREGKIDQGKFVYLD